MVISFWLFSSCFVILFVFLFFFQIFDFLQDFLESKALMKDVKNIINDVEQNEKESAVMKTNNEDIANILYDLYEEPLSFTRTYIEKGGIEHFETKKESISLFVKKSNSFIQFELCNNVRGVNHLLFSFDYQITENHFSFVIRESKYSYFYLTIIYDVFEKFLPSLTPNEVEDLLEEHKDSFSHKENFQNKEETELDYVEGGPFIHENALILNRCKEINELETTIKNNREFDKLTIDMKHRLSTVLKDYDKLLTSYYAIKTSERIRVEELVFEGLDTIINKLNEIHTILLEKEYENLKRLVQLIKQR